MDFNSLAVLVVGAVVTVGCLFVLALCRAASDRDEPLPATEPLHERRLRLVKRAQDEIAFQAKYGRMPNDAA